MKNIPPSALPHFHGMSSEDPDSFLFEFDILCRSYNYILDAQKLKLFPATLKESALRWFMGLGEHTIRTWEEMKSAFLKKYQEYCRTRDSRNDIFRMQQQEDESLEDYVERFVYNLQKNRNDLNLATIRTIFLKGILEENIDILNLMASGDVSHKSFEDIVEMCRKYSRSKAKVGKGVRVVKSSSGGITRLELGNLLENFKTDILGTISAQMDTLNIKKKFEDEALAIFCSRCKKKHPIKNCPLNSISVCGVCVKDHTTEDCLSLPGLQSIYKGANEPAAQQGQRKPWQQRAPGMLPDPYSQMNNYSSWGQWQNMNNQPFVNQSWPQNWRGNPYGPIPQQSYYVPYAHYPTLAHYQMPYPMQSQAPSTQLNAPQMQNQPLQLPPTQNPQRPPQLPVQPMLNPNNNKTNPPIYNTDIHTLPTYFITSVPLLGVQLRSGRSLQPKPSTVTIEEHIEEPQEDRSDEDLEEAEKEKETVTQLIIQTRTSQASKNPPYPERLAIEKPIAVLEFNLEVELKNLCVRIPLLQAIKDILIYAKIVRELCLKKSGRKKKDPPTIHYIGQSTDALFDRPVEKYGDPRNPVVTISIRGILIPNTLIDLGETINAITLQTIQ